jgi:carbonic anhydrase
MNRIGLSKTIIALALGALSACRSAPEPTTQVPEAVAGHATEASKVSPKEAAQRLIDGNARFVAGDPEHPRQDAEHRTALANTQHPFAIILSCADSRASPELLFDQGFGDLFVVREAGNVLDDHTLGSIEYGAEHLHSPLIVVMGHKRCGAIAAARDTIAAKGKAEGHIASLVEAIRPAVEATNGQDADATCRANIRSMVQALRTSEPILKHMVDEGEVAVVGAYYDLDSGAVTYLQE